MARWIKRNVNIDFVGKRKTSTALSIVMVLASIGMLIFNWLARGDALNYSTDFKGGSEIQVIFGKDIKVAELRSALQAGGFKGFEVVEVAKNTCPEYTLTLGAAPKDGTKTASAIEAALADDGMFRATVKDRSARLEFLRSVDEEQVTSALKTAGIEVAGLKKLKEGECPRFMLRLVEVSAFSEADTRNVKASLNKTFGAKNITEFDYKAGGDKVYVNFERGFRVSTAAPEDEAASEQDPKETRADQVQQDKQTAADIARAFKDANIEVQQVQRFGRVEDNVFEVALAGLERDIRGILERSLGEGAVKDVPQVESVGAKMGKQLRDDGIKAVIYALLLMLVYIAFRFDFHYAPGAVVALAHDVVITAGVFAVTWQEFSLSVVAALLTIAGYSINDTIVIYDRIRENVAKLRDRKFPKVVNASINETLSRTLLTSLTTLFTCVSIWIVGTGVLKTFAFALTIGVLVGTYSSVFVASPLVIYLNEKLAQRKKAKKK